MNKTKVKKFTAAYIEELNDFLDNPNIAYVDLKIIERGYAILIYKEIQTVKGYTPR